MHRSVGRVSAVIYLAVSLVVTYIVLWSPVAFAELEPGDALFFAILALHYAWGVTLLVLTLVRPGFRRASYRWFLLGPEILGAISLLLFLFSFVYALNANMDYVQRFIEGGGAIRLALDTRTERLLVWVRVFPLVALNFATYVLLRVGRPAFVRAVYDDRFRAPDLIARPWAFVLTLLAAFLRAIAMPSFLSLDGFPILGWIAFVPLFLVFRSVRFGHAVFYGIVFGGFSTLLTNYWLGTFNLISLQVAVLFFVAYYVVLTPLALYLYRSVRAGRVLVFPLAFTVFEFLRSIGFLGYPWALAAHSQYSVLPIIQVAEITGVWGVSFLVLLGNAAIAEFLGALIHRASVRWTRSRGPAYGGIQPISVRRGFAQLTIVVGVVGLAALAGGIALAANAEPDPDARTVTVAQIQQNTDPRKNDYDLTLNTLVRLTNDAMQENPDLVVWSETAFVPNIRRWSEDQSNRRFHRLVRRFLSYQERLETWLVTGNDDYELVETAEGTESRHYNAAVLFDSDGIRRETYRKIRLVPFTEYFPYREQFPRIYNLLLEFEMVFWEKGIEQTVFEHPMFTFSTPICYEDAFPDYVRGFVLNGAEVIMNISNDYWSLAEAQAKQHFVAGLFRAVENRRPLVRTTASGLTGYIDPYGRIVDTAPYFEPVYLVSDVRIRNDQPTTLYTRWGDYFPVVSAVVLGMLWIGSLVRRFAAPVQLRGERAARSVRDHLPARRDRADQRDDSARTDSSPEQPRAAEAESERPAAEAADAAKQDDDKPKHRRKTKTRPSRRTRKGGVNWRDIWNEE